MGYRFAAWSSAVAGSLAGALVLLLASAVGQITAFAQAAAGRPGAATTVLDGVYTAAQAGRGAATYDAQCASCHDGADVDGPPLTGTPFIDRWREDTLESLFEFVRKQMPQTAPGSLSDAAAVDIVAHLLQENDFQAGSRELTTDLVTSTLLVGPNGPQPLPSGALVRVVGCLTQNPAREWVVARADQPARVRVGNEITAAEAAAAAATASGTQTFTLQNVGDGGTVLPGDGHRVLVKGALTQRTGASRIFVTAAKSVAATCG
jgi:mono/diheme cytochrome c family protein